MKYNSVLVAVILTVVFAMPIWAQQTDARPSAQTNLGQPISPTSTEGQAVQNKIAATTTSRTDGGAIVLEDNLLNPVQKHIVFVASRNIAGEVYVAFQTLASDGQLHQHQMLFFPQGLYQGQTFELWNGEFNDFQSTPWLRFDVTILAVDVVYYTMMQTPILQAEQYKEPFVENVSETRVSGDTYTITARGVFYAFEPSTVVLNTNIFVPGKSVIHPGPGVMQFTVDLPTWRLPKGKYLLTVCQTGHCDTMTARHR